MESHFLLFFHSLLRYGVLFTVAIAGLMHLIGYLQKRPILNGERGLAIAAVIFCHTQLAIGAILYGSNFGKYSAMEGEVGRFWKMEHLGVMLIAILLVTMGRVLSKRAKEERAKQKRVAVFYLTALVLMLWAIPWPFTQLGSGRGWL